MSIADVSNAWVHYLPDGAVSVEARGTELVLRASQKLQERFEALLAKRKAGELTEEESRQFDAIADLDDALSWLNRLARTPASG
jgi:hypothetical protein